MNELKNNSKIHPFETSPDIDFVHSRNAWLIIAINIIQFCEYWSTKVRVSFVIYHGEVSEQFQRSNNGCSENLEIWDTLEALSDAICNALHYKMNVTECITVEICLYYK